MGSEFQFGGRDSLREALENRKREMLAEVDRAEESYLLGVSPDQLADHLVGKYEVDVPELDLENAAVEPTERRERVDDVFGRGTFEKSINAYELHIPFSGSDKFFSLRASTYTMGPVPIEVRGDAIVSTILQRGDEAQVRADLEHRREGIVKCHGFLVNDLRKFNDELRPLVSERVKKRRDQILGRQSLAANLGFKLKAKPGTGTYVVPAKKRVVPSRPPTPKPGAPLEPALDMAEYDHILKTISNMAVVMERAPHAFEAADEHALRFHFLVQLNAQYEGGAGGEMFNYEGKTDILIRHEGRNIFIAECKIWSGEAAFKDALSQLLGYLTWRDTKAAVLLFNRKKDFTAVVAKMKEALRTHPNFVREVPYASPTSIRAVMKHRDDPEREIYVTCMAFDVPSG